MPNTSTYRKRMKLEHRCTRCGVELREGYMLTNCLDCREETAKWKRERYVPAGDDLPEEPKKTVPRCKCGLALPCNSCLPSSAAWFANLRPGADYP